VTARWCHSSPLSCCVSDDPVSNAWANYLRPPCARSISPARRPSPRRCPPTEMLSMQPTAGMCKSLIPQIGRQAPFLDPNGDGCWMGTITRSSVWEIYRHSPGGIMANWRKSVGSLLPEPLEPVAGQQGLDPLQLFVLAVHGARRMAVCRVPCHHRCCDCNLHRFPESSEVTHEQTFQLSRRAAPPLHHDRSL
jgi:hypothetical protein